MPSTITPSWTDTPVSVIAAQTLAKGATVRGTVDLRNKPGARLFVRIGFGSSSKTATATGIMVWARALANNGAAGYSHPSGQSRQSSTVAPAQSTVGTDSASGQAALNVVSSTGFAAQDVVCIWDSGNTTFARLEFQRISKVTAGVLTMDKNLDFTHTAAQADTVRNISDCFSPFFLPGGSLYEVVIDYGAAATGDTAVVQAYAQTYDSDSAT
jgi:hypothetical protein